MYTPGHSIDQICIAMNGAVFTGDHILPQITPHPTIKRTYPDQILDAMPSGLQDRDEHYGLACYLKSLGKTLRLDVRTTVFPAHRLFNDGRFNMRNLQRAREIVRHHVKRLERIVELINQGADTPVKVTAGLFPARKLMGGGFFAAVSEVVSHLELLADIGDIRVFQNGRIQTTGTDTFHARIEAMMA